MRVRRVSTALLVVLLALLVTAGTGTATAAPANWLKKYQAQFLDPQASDGEIDIPPAPGTAALRGHHGASTTASSSASGFTQLPPEVGGQWDYLPSFPPEFNAVHVVAGPNGKILLIAGSGNNKANFAAGTFSSCLWEPATNQRRLIPTPEDMFCAGHTLLPDGRALVGGGTDAYGQWRGSKALYAFDFITERYEQLPPLEVGRWYPTAVTGADGRVLIVSGLDENGIKTNVTEVFDYRTNTHSRARSTRGMPNYVHLHLASNGKFFVADTNKPGFWDPYANTFRAVTGFVGPKVGATTMASCFVGDVRDQNLMVLGGGWPATNITRVIDLDAPTPTYREGPRLNVAKAYVGCVNLPDGSLFEANGGSSNQIAGASSEAAILTSVNANWTAVNPIPTGEHRVYHSLLFLLDSGQVISTTSNPKGEARNNSVLVYSPPYLFQGERPVITQSPVEVRYGGTYPVSATATGATVDRMTLTAAPSPTHSMDSNQRYLSLPVINDTITVPTSGAILPPGWYRLWAVDSLGRPSVASWIHLS